MSHQSGTTLTRGDARTSTTWGDSCGRRIVNTALWDGSSVTEILLIVEWNLARGEYYRKAIVDHCIEVAPGKLVFRKTATVGRTRYIEQLNERIRISGGNT